MAGQRVAINLAGIEVADISRGETLTQPDAVTVTRRADVRIELLGSAKPLRHGARVRFHQGTRELLGRIALAGSSEVEPGVSACGRLHFEASAVLVRGDRFILRAYSPLATIAGGTVLDPRPPRRGVRTPAGIARFAKLSEADSTAAAVMTMIEEAGLSGLPVAQLVGRAGVRWSDRDQLVAQLDGRVVQVGNVLVSASRLTAVEEAMLATVAQYHTGHPLEDGMPREELRERLFGNAPIAIFEEARVREAMVQILRDAALAPPDAATLASRIGVKVDVIDRIANLLVRQQVLVRADDLVFHESALTRLKTEIRSLREAGGIATLDVAAFKGRYNVTRKYAIPLLEFLDRERITRRVGDVRHIL